MDDYTLEHFQVHLRALLKPHSIGVRVGEERLNELSIETWRINAVEMVKVLVLTVDLLTPELARRFADVILEHYETHS